VVKNATFRIDGQLVTITNTKPRGQSVVLIVIAAMLAVLPLVRPYLPDGLIDYPPEDKSPWMLWLVGIYASLSAAFWWSVVTIDPAIGRLSIFCRWGLHCSKRGWQLSSFDSVTLRKDNDGEVSVYLEGRTRNWLLETNNDKAIVWGRPYEEARAVAETLANHLQFALVDLVRTEPIGLPPLKIP
jgi:hypothetical protein